VTIERRAFETILPFFKAQAGVFDSIKKVKDAAKESSTYAPPWSTRSTAALASLPILLN